MSSDEKTEVGGTTEKVQKIEQLNKTKREPDDLISFLCNNCLNISFIKKNGYYKSLDQVDIVLRSVESKDW